MANSLQKSSKGDGKPEQLNSLVEKCGFVLQFLKYIPHLWEISKGQEVQGPDLIIFYKQTRLKKKKKVVLFLKGHFLPFQCTYSSKTAPVLSFHT